SKGAELASKIGGRVEAVLVGNIPESTAQELALYGAKKVYILENSNLQTYNTLAFVKVLGDLVSQEKPEILFGAASPAGRDFFPRLAARLNTGLSSDTTGLTIDSDGKMLATRPIYSGKALADVKISDSLPQMALIRPNSFGTSDPQAGATCEIVKVAA